MCEIDRKDIRRTYVKKWIDYSNKFGFGYQLSDNSIGVIFNDGVRMQTCDKKTIVMRDFDGVTKTKYYVGDVPQELKDRNKLLHHFKQYMEENLADPIHKEESIHCSGTKITRKNILYSKLISSLKEKTFSYYIYYIHNFFGINALQNIMVLQDVLRHC